MRAFQDETNHLTPSLIIKTLNADEAWDPSARCWTYSGELWKIRMKIARGPLTRHHRKSPQVVFWRVWLWHKPFLVVIRESVNFFQTLWFAVSKYWQNVESNIAEKCQQKNLEVSKRDEKWENLWTCGMIWEKVLNFKDNRVLLKGLKWISNVNICLMLI